MHQQKAADRNQSKPRGGPSGAVTRAKSLGQGVSASANNNTGNGRMNKGGTRPITTGTKAPSNHYGGVTRKKYG